ncbi:MAG TPA: alpha/beta fold hydrolase [bacterium]|nr:alpha/beta fold hydrolase [bacterium]HOM26291.1 alpha/beta fold hydrolase [bacterium]
MEKLLSIYNEVYKIINSVSENKNEITEINLFNEKRKAGILFLPDFCSSVLIILPGAGYNEKFQKSVFKNFKFLLKKNIGICIFNLNNGNLDKEDVIFFNYFKEKIGEIRGIIEYIKNELKIKNVNLLGISFGGILGFIVAALEKEIKKSIFILSGVNLEFITWKSLLRFRIKKDCKRVVCKRMHKVYRNLLKNNLYNEILNLPRKCFLYDPFTYLTNLIDREILMINSIFDMIIPFYCVLEVKKRLKNVKTLWYPSTHLTLKFFIPFIRKNILNFLKNENISGN